MPAAPEATITLTVTPRQIQIAVPNEAESPQRRHPPLHLRRVRALPALRDPQPRVRPRHQAVAGRRPETERLSQVLAELFGRELPSAALLAGLLTALQPVVAQDDVTLVAWRRLNGLAEGI